MRRAYRRIPDVLLSFKLETLPALHSIFIVIIINVAPIIVLVDYMRILLLHITIKQFMYYDHAHLFLEPAM